MNELDEDEESEKNFPNRKQRSVRSGHFVTVKTTPLPRPRLVIASEDMAKRLGFSPDDVKSDEFLRFFSADPAVAPTYNSWATPYALSQGGQRVYSNCPFRDGTGYGDGRAASVVEVVIDGTRYECQLKGSGPTPFCRGGDGRAVLRSSVREFLASEAMFALGVETTRALCCVVSESEIVRRPWYSEEMKNATVNKNDARMKLTAQQLAPQLGVSNVDDVLDMLVALVVGKSHRLLGLLSTSDQVWIRSSFERASRNPDVMQREAASITTRVSPSFIRIGHLDLHARRVVGDNPTATAWRGDYTPMLERAKADAKDALVKIVKHTLIREFANVDKPTASLSDRVLLLVQESARRIARMVANWLRVGYCQGNCNADNFLVAGRTMDYGPFGFIEVYERHWNMWTGGGRDYSFMNQPNAAFKNFKTLVDSLMPLLESSEARLVARNEVESFPLMCQDVVNDMWCRKLGFRTRTKVGVEIFRRLEALMERSKVDYTIFWRELSEIPALSKSKELSGKELFDILSTAFYATPREDDKISWREWLEGWLDTLFEDERDGSDEISARMKRTNPKFVPREWMLVDAYEAAAKQDYTLIHELHNLFRRPYDEASKKMSQKYYTKAPDGSQRRGGTGFMT